MKKSTIKKIEQWQVARKSAKETEINKISATYAKDIGFPTLAAIYQLLDKINEANQYISKIEIESELRQILHIATGEATARIIKQTKDSNLQLSGLNSVVSIEPK